MNEAFTISDSAAARIAHLLKTEPAGTRLRVGVDGGGCSGFQYRFDFEVTPTSTGEKNASPNLSSDDQLFGTAAAPVIVDAISLEYLKGAQLDYIERMDSAAFEITNPQAKSSCGCGNSFSVAL